MTPYEKLIGYLEDKLETVHDRHDALVKKIESAREGIRREVADPIIGETHADHLISLAADLKGYLREASAIEKETVSIMGALRRAREAARCE